MIIKKFLCKSVLISGVFAGLLNAQTPDGWIQKANSGTGNRQGAVGFSINDKGYIGTGLVGGSYKNDFWEYNPITDVWSQKANFGGANRQYAVGFSITNKGYIGTGFIATFPPFKKDFWEYDPTNNTWIQKTDFPGTSRVNALGFSIGNKGYIGCGQNSSNGVFSDFWEYDPITDSWTQIADYGGGVRSYNTVFTIGSKAFVGLGADAVNQYRKDFWQYDQNTGIWTQIANYGGSSRFSAVGFSIANKGYVGLGTEAPNTNPNDMWEYTPLSNTWTQKNQFPGVGRNSSLAFNINCKGYIGTGAATVTPYDLLDFWEYTPWIIDTIVIMNNGQLISNQLGASYQWIDCNNSNSPILGATNQSYTPVSNGNYAVVITLGGCVATSICSAFITTGIESNNSIPSNSIIIFPNPNNGSFNIKTESESNFKIINDLGQTVKEVRLNSKNNFNITIDDMSNGVYILVSLNNKQKINQKIIITK